MGVAILLALRFPRWGAWTLLGLFAVQFAIVDTTGRLLLCGLMRKYWTNGPGTDILARSPACKKWEADE